MSITEIHCAHGTTASRAASIQGEGFRIGEASFWGFGVYFFHKHPDGLFLASKWHSRTLATGGYEYDEDKAFAVVYAVAKSDEANVFNLFDENIYPRYQALLDSFREKKYSDDQKNHIRDKFLLAFEQFYGTTIKILLASIPVPIRYFDPVREAGCVVVKDTNCIKRPFEIEVPYERKND